MYKLLILVGSNGFTIFLDVVDTFERFASNIFKQLIFRAL